MGRVVTEKTHRMHALVIRRLQTAGADGLNASELAPMVHDEFGGTHDRCRNLLILMAEAGMIYRKPVSQAQGGKQSRYFLEAAWRDAYVPPMKLKDPERKDGYVAEKHSIPAPVSFTKSVNKRFMDGDIIIPEHVQIQVLPAFQGDYRIQPDPVAVQRIVNANECRGWAKALG